MHFNLGALRDFCLAQRAWASTGTDFNNRLRQAFSHAYARTVGDVPKAFQPEQYHVKLYKHVLGASTTGTNTTRRYLRRTTDDWVLEFVDSTGAPYPFPVTPGAWVPNVDGTWDGIMHLELEDPSGNLYRRQSREWWFEVDQKDFLTRYYVSLDRPMDSNVGLAMNLDFRIVQPRFYLPAKLIKVIPPFRIWDPTRSNVWPIEFSNAMTFQLGDYRGTTTGRPGVFARDDHFQLQAPNRAPVITAAQSNWAGPENKGTFRFYYTRVWGKTSNEWGDAPGGTRDPTWESAPSPVSSSYTQPGASAITITVPEIDWMQNFGDITTLRYSRTGYRTRIYVARDDVILGAPGTHPTVEKAGIPYLLAEIDGIATTYTWDGSVVPDYFRRMQHSTGYYGFMVAPHPYEDYTLDVQAVSLPDILLDDQDTPRLHPDAQSALVEIFLHYLARLDGQDEKSANNYLANYRELVRNLRERYGQDTGVIMPIPFTGQYQYGTYLASTFTTTSI